jgi:glycosyltransferase involved in cell wall biosynthesis
MGYLKPNEMITQFEKSMCLVHPSYIDNSPNSVCEAQLCGIPVIASNVGGLESLIENNKTGILVDLDSKLIAEKILYLYHHPETRKIISENSHKMALQRHDKLFIINKVIDMYRHIIMHHKLDSKSF